MQKLHVGGMHPTRESNFVGMHVQAVYKKLVELKLHTNGEKANLQKIYKQEVIWKRIESESLSYKITRIKLLDKMQIK
jgi:hypothetical protein